MKILITGSSGHLGEALVRTLRPDHQVLGLDVAPSPFTDTVGSIVDRAFVRECVAGVDAVLHTATLHKPHVATHTKEQFVDVNVSGTLHLLEAAAEARVGTFVFTSTTSVFGRALQPAAGQPATWVTEDVVPIPRNIYGATKAAAEDLCELIHRDAGLPVVVLRTSRFFPEADDDASRRASFDDTNLKTNELLHRRVDLADVVSAHQCAVEHAARIGFGRYIISATTPFVRGDLEQLRTDPAEVVARYVPRFPPEYARRGWRMYDEIDRVYVNRRAREELGWRPHFDFKYAIDQLIANGEPASELARAVGSKGYHDDEFDDGPYPVG